MLKRQEITKGFSVIAQWQGMRTDAAREIKRDRRYYRRHGRKMLEPSKADWTITLNQLFLRRSKTKARVPDKHITADRVAEVIAGKLLFALGEIPNHYPCGMQDDYGERQDHALRQAKRLIAAYKVLRALERGEI